MGLLDKLKFHAWDNTGAVADLIAKWTPTGCNTEKDYEKSLYTFLDEQLGDVAAELTDLTRRRDFWAKMTSWETNEMVRFAQH